MEEANFLTRFGQEVTLVHRREAFRSSKIMLEPSQHPKLTSSPIRRRRYLRCQPASRDCRKAANLTTGNLDARRGRLFCRHRHIPNTAHLPAKSSSTRTVTSSQRAAAHSVTGVFHAATSRPHLPAGITASGAGCMAAIEVERFLEAEGNDPTLPAL